ncbi:MAG: DUF3187 family protein [Thermoanaerobaculia bacterium]
MPDAGLAVSFRAIVRAVILIAVLLACSPALANDEEFFGPLRIRDLSPLAILRLDMPPAHAVTHYDRGWGVEVHYSRANIFAASDSVVEYLRARPTRGVITEQEAEEIFALEGDVFYFDFEAAILAFSTTWAPVKNWQVNAYVPFHYHGGGDMDGTIEQFHETFGLGNGNRDIAPRGEAQILERVGPDRFAVLAIGNNQGLADPTLSIRHSRQLGRWNAVGEVAVKPPIGKEEEYFSTGGWDYGAQLSFQRKFDRRAFYLSLSNIWVGDTNILPNFRVNTAPTVAMALERSLSPRTSVVFQGTWSRSNFTRAFESEAAEDRTQLSAGIRRRRGNLVYMFAVTENVANFNNTPDLALHWGMAYMRPRK